jgi:acyl-CoA synthetase (AMP-forming)/AMP-acid ligase II
MLLSDLVYLNVLRRPDKTAVACGDASFTFREFFGRINRLANALLKLCERGSRVAVLQENSHQYFEAYFGIPQGGMVLNHINYRLSPGEMAQIINHAEAEAIIVGDNFVETIESVRRSLNTVKHFICVGSPQPGMLNYEELLEEASDSDPGLDLKDTDLAWLMYTSGTTGFPKGVMCTHKSLVAGVHSTMLEIETKPEEVFLNVFPLCHMASYTALVFLHRGCKVILAPRFDPRDILETIQNQGVTAISLAPTMINFILEYPGNEDYDTSSLSSIRYGASSIPENVLRKGIKRFGNVFSQGYGMTETCAALTLLKPEEHVVDGSEKETRRLRSCGRPSVTAGVRVVSKDGADVKPGEVGEVIMMGDMITPGYWRNPEATAEALRDGWLHSGDLATVDEEGFIYIVERKKDMIISGAENIYPNEVENVIYSHPGVMDAAVIGLPDDTWGEVVTAVVVPREGEKVTQDEIVELCRQNLAGYKKPRKVFFADELPRNPSGKVLRKVLREKYGNTT